MPPLAPPKGTLTTAFLTVIQAGQGHHLGQRHVLVIADAALARPARGVVLHPVALEVGDLAVVETDRHIDDQRALGPAQGFHPGLQPGFQQWRDLFDLVQENAPGADVFGGNVGRQLGLRHGFTFHAPSVIRVVLPPAAVVLMLTTHSTSMRYKG